MLNVEQSGFARPCIAKLLKAINEALCNPESMCCESEYRGEYLAASLLPDEEIRRFVVTTHHDPGRMRLRMTVHTERVAPTVIGICEVGSFTFRLDEVMIPTWPEQLGSSLRSLVQEHPKYNPKHHQEEPTVMKLAETLMSYRDQINLDHRIYIAPRK